VSAGGSVRLIRPGAAIEAILAGVGCCVLQICTQHPTPVFLRHRRDLMGGVIERQLLISSLAIHASGVRVTHDGWRMTQSSSSGSEGHERMKGGRFTG
jgi:hypothetical protein